MRLVVGEGVGTRISGARTAKKGRVGAVAEVVRDRDDCEDHVVPFAFAVAVVLFCSIDKSNLPWM